MTMSQQVRDFRNQETNRTQRQSGFRGDFPWVAQWFTEVV
jgi:hypothetical protein